MDYAPNVFYSLESQTKPNYWLDPERGSRSSTSSRTSGSATPSSLERWPDMWLNEGFATWSEWIWTERSPAARPAQEQFDELYAIPEDSAAGQDLWFPAPNALGRRVRAVPHARSTTAAP